MLPRRSGCLAVIFFLLRNRSLHLSNILIEPHKEEEVLAKPEDVDESNAGLE